MIRLKVQEVAKAKGFSLYRLAKESGVNEGTLRRIYRYPTDSIVNTDTLDRLATTLDVDVTELLESVKPDDQTPPAR